MVEKSVEIIVTPTTLACLEHRPFQSAALKYITGQVPSRGAWEAIFGKKCAD